MCYLKVPQGGGGRFDPGILYYHSQMLASDNTDPVDFLKILYGASIIYPISSIESLIAPVPNFLSRRITSLKMRGHVSMCGVLGYYFDIRKLTSDEKEFVKKQVAIYKKIRQTIQFGNFYRLLNPFEGNEAAWMFVSEDKTKAFVAYFRTLNKVPGILRRLRLKGLDTNMDYKLIDSKKTFGGDELIYLGLNIPKIIGDFQSIILRLKAIK